MRYKFTEHAPSGKRQYFIALGVNDLEILKGLVDNAMAHMPRLQKNSKQPRDKTYTDVYDRLRSMSKPLSDALDEAKKLEDDGKRKKVSPTELYIGKPIKVEEATFTIKGYKAYSNKINIEAEINDELETRNP